MPGLCSVRNDSMKPRSLLSVLCPVLWSCLGEAMAAARRFYSCLPVRGSFRAGHRMPPTEDSALPSKRRASRMDRWESDQQGPSGINEGRGDHTHLSELQLVKAAGFARKLALRRSVFYFSSPFFPKAKENMLLCHFHFFQQSSGRESSSLKVNGERGNETLQLHTSGTAPIVLLTEHLFFLGPFGFLP